MAVNGSQGVEFAVWGCADYRGYCRAACFAFEYSLGPKGCTEGYVCCVPNTF
uniref:CFBD-1 beta-defensin n=1 Tax=Cynops fudingensis TaxID=872626 RepID=W0FEW1_9SALA|nr:CFBD-1 beta-defensin precursor [Cynops fudingensis]